jgi:hypothetical protein
MAERISCTFGSSRPRSAAPKNGTLRAKRVNASLRSSMPE